MPDERKKGKQQEKETMKPGKSRKDDLSEKDLDKASGGLNPQPLPPDKLPPY